MKNFIAICKKYFGYAMLFSMFINILQLTFSIYMLQVYDKVLTSYNLSTLVVITFAAITSLITLGLLEWIRSRLLIRISIELNNLLSSAILYNEIKQAVNIKKTKNTSEMRDVHILRSFLGSSAIFSFFDMPWMPIYFILIFVLHPALGYVSLIGGVIIFAFGLVTQKLTHPKLSKATEINQKTNSLLSSAIRNAYVVNSMGMIEYISSRWHSLNDEVIKLQMKASHYAGLLHSLSKAFRLSLQVLIYAVGAYLAISHQTSAGAIIAASIIMGRALAPVDQAMATYKQSIEAWSAYKKLKNTLDLISTNEKMPLPHPHGDIRASEICFKLTDKLILNNISFNLRHGTSLAIIGPSASGKSSLCKLLLGIWPTTSGKISLDGADLSSWDSETLGAFLGYLPQDIELFDGTIAENIARMGEVNSEKVIRAAQLAGVHELILTLPNGYDTCIGNFGQNLSGGQRQRVALARALYGDPSVIVLDEPNSNLDEEGEAKLVNCIRQLKVMKKTVILITHKPSLSSIVDEILVLANGHVMIYGKRDGVLKKLSEMREAHKASMIQQHGASK